MMSKSFKPVFPRSLADKKLQMRATTFIEIVISAKALKLQKRLAGKREEASEAMYELQHARDQISEFEFASKINRQMVQCARAGVNAGQLFSSWVGLKKGSTPGSVSKKFEKIGELLEEEANCAADVRIVNRKRKFCELAVVRLRGNWLIVREILLAKGVPEALGDTIRMYL
jgi:hypothetical protein